ncbi:MAG TPA: hypothetical protein VNA66_10800 [Gammaproteobacteria bacterium]|nr:hypothetical protein [Gammaproteobacteria bacterium]
MTKRLAILVVAASICAVPVASFAQQEVLGEGDARASQPAAGQPTSTAAAAASADAAGAVSFEVGAGLEYDSNVAVLELDASTGAGDAAALLELGVAYDRPGDAKLDFGAGYHFSETAHEDFSAFDVRIHRGSANMSYDLGRFDIGANLQYADAALDGTEFLALAQLSPYLSGLVGRRLFLRFAYADSDKDFADNPARDATTSSFSSDAYVFINGLKTYLTFGHRYDDEDAGFDELDYTGQRFGIQLSQRFAGRAREITLKTHLRAESRDYRAVTPSIGALRRDDRLELGIVAEIPTGKHVVTRIGVRRADNDSNLPSVDFAETVSSVELSAKL